MRECAIVTVASVPLRASSSETGRPTSNERPITTARLPEIGTSYFASSSITPRGVAPTCPGHSLHEASEARIGEPVDILRGRDQVDDRTRVEAIGQRQLHEDAVDGRIGGERGDDVLHLGL